MNELNVSRITTIRFIGFQSHGIVQYWIFFLFLVIYCVTVCGNLLIITLVVYSKTLHSPMYFFLSQLSVSDIIIITDILPKMLYIVLVEEATISFANCISQFYFFAVAGTLQCVLLAVMSYDRYLAICRPLHYTLIMNPRFCWLAVITCWALSIFIMFGNTFTISQLWFCSPNTMDYFFCDVDPILELSCSDTTIVQIVVKTIGGIVVVNPFCVIIVSYALILVAIFKIPSISGRKKAFSTCSSHLTVVSIYYGTMVGVYFVPRRRQSWNMVKFLSLLYTVVTPMMNPIIYTLRNKDFKESLRKLIKLSASLVKQ